MDSNTFKFITLLNAQLIKEAAADQRNAELATERGQEQYALTLSVSTNILLNLTRALANAVLDYSDAPRKL